MNARLNLSLRVAAVSAAVAVVAAMAATPAFAADGDVKVVNTETVQVYTSPTGEIQTRRVYEQLALTGNGPVDIKNPISTDGLRNLDGFGGFQVVDGNQVTKTTVDGEENVRSVSNYEGKLPLDISVKYTLDGKTVDPSDVVGKSGALEVQYTVKNITGEDQEVTFPDGTGGTVTKTVNVPIPMVGSLTTTAPSSFTNVKSVAANMAGDGEGGTKLSFTMTLFPPIGSDTAVFGYTADIVDGIVPPAEVSALPINPMESPTFSSAATSYKGGADTGAELAAGATEIDANLLKLRDGAGDLLAGLLKLRAGAVQLDAGLAGEAAPGADKLAAGASELDGGLGLLNAGSQRLATGTGEALAGSKKLTDGAGQLSGGVAQLDTGAGALDAGAAKLAAGQKALAAGLKDLYDAVDALPASVRNQLEDDPDYQRLLGTLDAIVTGIGTPTSTGADTLMGGLFQVRGGLRTPFTYANNDCATALGGGIPSKCGVADAAEFMKSLLPAKKADLTCASAVLNDIAGGPDAPVACFGGNRPPSLADETNPTNAFVLNGLSTKLADGATSLDGLSAGLKSIQDGVDFLIIPGINNLRKALYNAPCDPTQTDKAAADFCGISQALSLVRAGVPQLVDALTTKISIQILDGLGKPTKGCNPEATLRCAAAALADGGTDLTDGVNQLVAGVTKLNAGGEALAAGAGDLSAGLGQLDDGANQLADGTSKAADGSGQLSDGASKLATGLGDAADGSGQIADGLKTAAAGAPKLEDGAQRLSDEGTKKLIAAGQSTAQNYGELYATIQAGADRAQTEDMAFGAPEGAIGLTAYSYEIQGDDGEGGRNLARGLGGLGILAAGAGIFALRRRFI